MFKEACVFVPVTENVRILVQMQGQRCFLPLDDMRCQGEMCSYSSHLPSGGREEREGRQPKDQERELKL